MDSALPSFPTSLTGRTWFLDCEDIPLRVPAGGDSIDVLFTAADGRTFTITVPAAEGQACFTVPGGVLAPGEWSVVAGAAKATVHVASSIALTPFTIGSYYASFEGDPPIHGLKGISSAERVRAFRDDYGVNLMMLLTGGYPLQPQSLDLLTQAETRFTTVNTHASLHQPDRPDNDWCDPEVVESLKYRTKFIALYLRGYEAFDGVHYADEPGLAWGIETADGRTLPLDGEPRPPQHGEYVGPMAAPLQRSIYKQATGNDAPDWHRPLDDPDAWLDFNRWRSTLLGEVFAEMTEALREVDTRLIGYSQIYEWAAIGDGIYPPEEAKGVDVLSTHAYVDRQLGMWYPAHETDAMRCGAWDKPLWMLPTWAMGITPEDGVRAAVYSTLAQKVEGLLWPQDWMMVWGQAREVSQKIIPISGMLLHTEKLRTGVGIFCSRDQHILGFGRDAKDWHGGKDYVGKLNTAWLTATAAHYPTSRVVEEDLLDGEAKAYPVLLAPGLTYARPEIVKALEGYIADGGVVFLESDTLRLNGARKLPFHFADWFGIARAESPIFKDWTDRRRFDELVMPNLAAFKQALGAHVKPLAACDNPMFMITQQGAGNARYLWVVNMAQEDRESERRNVNGRLLPRSFVAPAKGTVALPEGGYVAYDVFAGKQLDGRTQQLDLDKGDARIYALMPAAIETVKIERARWKPPVLRLNAKVAGARGAVDAVIPIAIEIRRDGAIFRRFYRATFHGKYGEELALGAAAAEGRWSVTVTELLSGKSAGAEFVVKSRGKAFATAGPVEVIDADRIADALRSGAGDVLLLYGDAASERSAKKLLGALAAKGVHAAADAASNHLAERPTTRHTCNPQPGAPLAIGKQVVLLGSRETNKLIARMVDTYRLCPRIVGAGYPGGGRALLYWSQGMFGLHNDIVVVYADDAGGLRRGEAALEAVLNGRRIPGVKTLNATIGPLASR